MNGESLGFGWSFYGFFLAAFLWLVGYFLWAFTAAARDRRVGDSRSMTPGAGHSTRSRHRS